MNPTHSPVHAHTDMRWLRWSLAAIALLLMVIAVELSVLVGPLQPRAQAQIPDSGAQLMQLIEGQKVTNQILAQILDHLRTREIKARLIDTDKNTGGASPAPARRPVKAAPKPQTSPQAK